jgi:hypothetical protein
VAPEVEQAVVDAWRRRPAPSGDGLWLHILGQIRPTREPRVRLIFEILRQDRSDAPQLLSRALEARNLDASAVGVAATLAAESLRSAPNQFARRLCLDVLRTNGTREQLGLVRDFADNPMVAEELRREARTVADTIAGRR